MNKPIQAVLIITDTQRADMLGCYGNPDMKTPSLDTLAAGGIRFDRAYTCQPVCGPARAALFTGTYPHTNGSWGNNMPLGDTFKTIGQRLRDRGVSTGYVGKWHLDGSDYFGTGKCPDGWNPDYWYDMRSYLEELTDDERRMSRMPPSRWEKDVPEEFTFGHRCSDRAVAFIEEHRDQSFFLTVSYDEPHGPFLCPRKYTEMYRDYEFPKSENIRDDLKDKPEHHRIWACNRHVKQDKDALKICLPDYFGCNTFVDYEIGRVLNALDGLAPDALVIYSSDHGDALNSHSLSSKGCAMYEEITRIPFIVRWPGHAPEGAVCRHPVSHIDVVPAVLDVFGIDRPPLLEGKSMKQTFCDPDVRTNDAVFIEFGRYELDHDCFMGFQPIRCIFDGRCKLTINLLTSDELYDLDVDPAEMNNVIEEPGYAEIRDCLHDRLLDWMHETRDPFRGYYWARRPWRKDAPPASWADRGMIRQRKPDGYMPPLLNYGTGLPFDKPDYPR